jgi:hypothetical protein
MSYVSYMSLSISGWKVLTIYNKIYFIIYSALNSRTPIQILNDTYDMFDTYDTYQMIALAKGAQRISRGRTPWYTMPQTIFVTSGKW